jgi:hypothetical protein
MFEGEGEVDEVGETRLENLGDLSGISGAHSCGRVLRFHYSILSVPMVHSPK